VVIPKLSVIRPDFRFDGGAGHPRASKEQFTVSQKIKAIIGAFCPLVARQHHLFGLKEFGFT
jgi:hypothetical protein